MYSTVTTTESVCPRSRTRTLTTAVVVITSVILFLSVTLRCGALITAGLVTQPSHTQLINNRCMVDGGGGDGGGGGECSPNDTSDHRPAPPEKLIRKLNYLSSRTPSPSHSFRCCSFSLTDLFVFSTLSSLYSTFFFLFSSSSSILSSSLTVLIGHQSDCMATTTAKLLPTGSSLVIGANHRDLPRAKRSTDRVALGSTTPTANTLPAHFDWRTAQKVTPVRDQNTCNACYAFAVTSAVESALAIHYRLNVSSADDDHHNRTESESELSSVESESESESESDSLTYVVTGVGSVPPGNLHLVDLRLSVQQLIDCTSSTNGTGNKNNATTTRTRNGSVNTTESTTTQSAFTTTNDQSYHNQACKFGYIEDTFRYVVRHGLVAESRYPYTRNRSVSCRWFAPLVNRTFIASYRKLVAVTDQHIQWTILNNGPVISLINDQGADFLYYRDGIVRNDSSQDSIKPNHAVLIVGWGVERPPSDDSESESDSESGSDSTISYWIVKNSWGVRWGNGGYGRVQFGARSIGRYVYYPVLVGNQDGTHTPDLFRSVIVYVFLAVLLFSLVSAYCTARLCVSDFCRRTVLKRRHQTVRIFYWAKHRTANRAEQSERRSLNDGDNVTNVGSANHQH